MMAGIITAATGLKAQNLIAHFPLDENGNSTALGGLASKTTDGEFGSEGVNFNTGTSATFNVTTSIIQHDLNPESFTLTLWARSEGGAGAWNSLVTSRHALADQDQARQID